MNNKEIIDEIRSHLTKEQDIDIAYLQTELEIYKKMNNEEVIYAIANMLFQYLDPKIKEQLDLKTHAILDERRQEYEKVVKLLADEKFQEAKEILLKLSKTFKKASYVREQNYYDFDQMIEYFIFCENVENAKNLKVRRYPEPITYYMYQLSCIYQLENNLEEAILALEEALNYNPRCQYVMQELALLYDKANKHEEAFELIKESLKYAYTKEQLANAYQYIAYFYEKRKCYDIAIVAYLTSDNYRTKPINKDLVNDLVATNGKIEIKNDGIQFVENGQFIPLPFYKIDPIEYYDEFIVLCNRVVLQKELLVKGDWEELKILLKKVEESLATDNPMYQIEEPDTQFFVATVKEKRIYQKFVTGVSVGTPIGLFQYFATFQFENDEEIEYEIGQEWYEKIEKGQTGQLVLVNGNFFSFGEGEDFESV